MDQEASFHTKAVLKQLGQSQGRADVAETSLLGPQLTASSLPLADKENPQQYALLIMKISYKKHFSHAHSGHLLGNTSTALILPQLLHLDIME